MRKKRRITSYGRLVLARLEANNMTMYELAQEVERRTGRFCDEKYIYKHLCGVPTPWPQREAIRAALNINGRKG